MSLIEYQESTLPVNGPPISRRQATPTHYLNPTYHDSAALKFFNRIYPTRRPRPTTYLDPTPRKKLSDYTLELLKGMHIEKYRSRAEHEAAAIMRLISSNFSLDECLELFKIHPVAGRFKKNQDIGWFKRAYKSAEKKRDLQFGSQTRKDLRDIQFTISNMPWPGRTGLSKQKIMQAHSEIAIKHGSFTYNASERRIEDLAYPISRNTIRKLRPELIKDGWLELIEKGNRRQGKSSNYRLTVPATIEVSPCPFDRREYTWINFATKPGNDSYSEVLSAKGRVRVKSKRVCKLTRTCRQVYECLRDSGPKSKRELKEFTGRGYAAIKAALERLSELQDNTGELHALVETVGTKWRAVLAIDWDYLAETLGVKGRKQDLRKRHESEREEHQEWMTGQDRQT